MKFYVVKYPDKKERIFLNEGDAKNCLGNLGDIHKGLIEVYFGTDLGKIVGTSKNSKNIYTYLS